MSTFTRRDEHRPILLTLFAVLLFCVVFPSRVIGSVVVGENINVSRMGGPQSETSIAIDPIDRTHLVIGSKDVSSDGQLSYVSRDGGSTWFSGVPLPLDNDRRSTWQSASDPSLVIDRLGHAYYSYIQFNRVNEVGALVVAASSDGGNTWQTPVAIVDQVNGPNANLGFPDKSLMAIDNTGGQRDGTLYVVWTSNDANGEQHIYVASSSTRGQSWSTPRRIDDSSSSGKVIAATPEVAENGDLYVVWDDFGASINMSNIMFAHSTDAGANWSSNCLASETLVNLFLPDPYYIPAQPDRWISANPVISVDRGNGPHRGRIYVGYVNQGAGGHDDTDILLRYSDNRGNCDSWSGPTRVNDDGGTRSQFMPALAVDDTDGSVHMTFYDARDDTTNSHVHVYYAQAIEGPAFLPNIRVTTVPSDESVGNAVRDQIYNFGDYNWLVAENGNVHAVWTDTRTGDEEVFTAAIAKCPPDPAPLSHGITQGGSLVDADCAAPHRTGSKGDLYSFSGTAGQQVAIAMRSSAFDTYLILVGPTGSVVALDDDTGAGTDSLISNFSLPTTGNYIIEATAFAGSGRGAYTLSVPGSVIFQDDIENGVGGWFAEVPWAQTTTTANSSTHSWTDSPSGNYSNNANVSLWSPVLNLSTVNSGQLTFWHHYDLEDGFDFGRVWVTTNNGVTFTQVASFTGTNTTWTQATINLDAFAGHQSVRIVFQLSSDSSITRDGWYIDDVVVFGSNGPFVFVSSYSDGTLYKVHSETGNKTQIGSGLTNPEDMTIDSTGILYIGGEFTGGVKRFDTKTNTFLTNVGTNVCGPEGPTIGPDGDLYVNTRNGPCAHSGIWKIAGRTASTAVQVVPPFSTWGEGTAFLKSGPFTGHLLASDSDGRIIRAVPPNFGSSFDFITGLQTPVGIAVNPSDGDVFVVERNLGEILRYDSSGAFKSVFAQGLTGPVDFLEFDDAGNLYVADEGSSKLLKFTPDGTMTILAEIPEIAGVALPATFTPITLLLTVTAPVNGTVAGLGISCPGDCTESYVDGKSVVLTANPTAGYQVDTWTSCDSVNGDQCTVQMTQPRTVSVTFMPITFLLTVSPVPANGFITATGISCGTGGTGDCSESYNSGTNVTLTGNPAAGFQTGTWTGCTPINNNTQCTVSMTQARTVSVTFTPITFLLTVSPVPTNGFITAAGISCGTGGTGDCNESYNTGTNVTLTGNPANGFQVGTWTGCTPVNNNTQCTVAMTQARTATATFSPANQAPDGTITSPASNVTITAGQSINFQGSGNDPDNNLPLSYQWNFGGGAPNSSVQNPGLVTFNTQGTYAVTLTVTDSSGLGDPTPATRIITVNPQPAAIFVEPAGICNGKTPCFPLIQQAIDAVTLGGTIRVGQGIYHENVVVNSSKNFTLEGGWDSGFAGRANDPALTIVDGDLTGDGIGEGPVFTVTTSNGADANLTVDGFTIQNGNGQYGGGIYAFASGGGLVELNLRRNIIRNNKSVIYGSGVGVYSQDAGSKVEAVLVNNIVHSNDSGGNGAGLYFFSDNSLGVTASVINNTITDNDSAGVGGGLRAYASNGSVTDVSVINSIIWGNTAVDGQDIAIRNSLGGTATVNTSYSDIGDVVPDSTAPGIYNDLGNNMDVDPRFVNFTGGDFHLGSGSPVVDAGTATGAPASDFENDPRPQGAAVDIGADERISSSGGKLAITNKSLPQGEVGVSYGIRLEVTGGQPPYSILITTALPSGLSLIGQNILGTPDISGKPKITVKATDQAGASITKKYTLTINKAVAISPLNLKAGTVGRKYGATLKVSGGIKPYSWSVASGALPTGLSLNGKGQITGVPTNAGSYTFTVGVTDGLGGIAETTLTLTIN